MRAFIFVYEGTKYRVDPVLVVKKFDLDAPKTWDLSASVDATTTIVPGIYGILSDLTISDSSIVAVDAAPSQYDILIIRDKDGWPDPKVAAWVRMKEAFRKVLDSDLELFLGAKGARWPATRS